MEIDFENDGEITVARVVGRVDTRTAQDFQSALSKHLQGTENPPVVMDFSGVDYVSSAGLRSILILARSAEKNNCALGLSNINDEVMQIFRIVGFQDILPIFESVSEAKTSLL